MGLFSYGISFENPVFFYRPGQSGHGLPYEGKNQGSPLDPFLQEAALFPSVHACRIGPSGLNCKACAYFTVILIFAFLPLKALAVIVAVPFFTPFTFPEADTVATFLLLVL